MSGTIIVVDHLWKKYRLGTLSTGTLAHDLNRWWHRVRGLPDPYSRVGEPQNAAQRSEVRSQRSEVRDQKPEVRSQTSDLRPLTSGSSDLRSPPSDLRAPASGLCSSPPSALGDDEIWALKDVCFEVKEGEILGIIGRNGAGKSTLLKILSRVTAPTQGEVRIKGRVASLLEVGTGFHPELTGRENIYLNGAILGMTKAEIRSKFDEIVAFAEVEKFIDTPVKRYSSGMYVRLAFGVAAHLEPEILVVDEVLAVGDAAFQKKCLGKMGEVAQGGRTVLFVSHNMPAVRQLCSKAILLEDGRKTSAGVADQIIQSYLASAALESACARYGPSAHAENTGEFCINGLGLTNAAGELAAAVRIGEEIQLKIQFEVRVALQDVRIGIGLNTIDGVRVATLHHTDGGAAPFGGEPGSYELMLRFQNPLLQGIYILSAGAHRAIGGQTVDYIPEALRLQVLPVSVNSEVPSYSTGLVRIHDLQSRVRRVESVR